MSKAPLLRRLLPRKRTENWLNVLQKLYPAFSLAIYDDSSRLLACSTDWQETVDPLTAQKTAVDSKAKSVEEVALEVSGEISGRLVVRGADPTIGRQIADLVGMTLNIWLSDAWEKARLFEETQTSARHLQELNRIGRSLSTTLDLQPLLEQIMEAAIEFTGSERGSIIMVDEKTQELVFRVVSEEEESFLVGRRLPIGTGIVGEVAAGGRPQIVNRVDGNESFFAGIDATTGFQTRSILAVPMIHDSNVIGVIELLNRRDGKPFQEQDINRLSAFSSQAEVAIETARLHQEEMTKQRMERELQLGHSMQSSLIPRSVPNLDGWQFAAWWQPAREVSGDFYDFVKLDEDIGVVVADVADKGVHAALFMSLSRSTVRTSLCALKTPSTSIFEANRLIAEDAPNGMFLTLCYAHFQPASGEVTYVNAGHNPPLWHHAGSGELQELPATGIFLGIDSGLPFEQQTIDCRPGDLLLFFTDGVTEAMNPQREVYGENRLYAALKALHDQEPGQIVQGIKQSLADFTQGAPQSDDITLVVARRMWGS